MASGTMRSPIPRTSRGKVKAKSTQAAWQAPPTSCLDCPGEPPTPLFDSWWTFHPSLSLPVLKVASRASRATTYVPATTRLPWCTSLPATSLPVLTAAPRATTSALGRSLLGRWIRQESSACCSDHLCDSVAPTFSTADDVTMKLCRKWRISSLEVKTLGLTESLCLIPAPRPHRGSLCSRPARGK